MSAIVYRPDIQGLRAIAVLSVMIFHLNPVWLPGGFVGVDVFLVISGFLITSILFQKKTQPNYSLWITLQDFYVSRFNRIAPAYFGMLLTVLFVAAIFYVPSDFTIFKKGLEKAAWFNGNTYFAEFGDYFAPSSHEQPLLHTWSLAVEIKFYLLAPFIVLIFPIRLLAFIFAALTIGLTAVAEYRLRYLGLEQPTYYSLYARLPEFFAGGLVAIYSTLVGAPASGRALRWPSLLGLLLLIAAMIGQPLLGFFPGVSASLPVLGALLLLGQTPAGIFKELLSSKILVWIGTLSYSLYLWHWPILAFLRYYAGTEVLNAEQIMLFLILTFTLSTVSYVWIERLFRRQVNYKKKRVAWVLIVLAALIAIQTAPRINAILVPSQLPIEYRQYADQSAICHGKIVGDCLRGDRKAEQSVLLLGDSHAAMLNEFFNELGRELSFNAEIITASSCVTIPGFGLNKLPEWARPPCKKQIEAAQSAIGDHQYIFLAGMWSYQVEDEKFLEGLDRFLRNNPTKTIYLLPQIPLLNASPQRVRRFAKLGLSGAEIGVNDSYQQANREIYLLSKNHKHVRFISAEDLKTSQLTRQFNKSLYGDNSHLNEVGSKLYAKFAKPIFTEILMAQ